MENYICDKCGQTTKIAMRTIFIRPKADAEEEWLMIKNYCDICANAILEVAFPDKE